MKTLDPFDIDLEKTTLIEASAGTGKTYTIASLFCRLVTRGYLVESILVVTFTEAAAAELKIRIRRRLAQAYSQLGSRASKTDDDLVKMLRSCPDLPKILVRLKTAVSCFDQASVMTIHAFCLKTLKENAFESRSFFDIELIPDRSAFLNQVACDYFMCRINRLDPLFLNFLAQNQFTPDDLVRSFSNLVSRRDMIIKPAAVEEKGCLEDRCDEYRSTVKQIHDLLLNRKDEIQALIADDPGIKKQSYSKKTVPDWLEKTFAQIEKQGPNTLFKMTEKGDPVYKFTHTRLAGMTKKGHLPPRHIFFDLCENLLSIYQGFAHKLIQLKSQFPAYFQSELEKIKAAQGICFFDDLVTDLASVLDRQSRPGKDHDSKEPVLADAVQKSYQACLIDEFQDTDPAQYRIFSLLFSVVGTPFFMVGDPKQAIYAFRGGDIFAYLNAVDLSNQKATLKTNYRSAPLLVTGINALFSTADQPFLFDAITFSSVNTPPAALDRLIEGDKPVPPLQFCFVSQTDCPVDKQGKISKAAAFYMIPQMVARDICSLLQSKQKLLHPETGKFESIAPDDIAVLVRTNEQAGRVQQALSRLNIPSYLSGSGSVFDSKHALDLHDILWAVRHPDQKGYIKAALATSIFGFTSAQMQELDEKEDLFFYWQAWFAGYKQMWETKGFVAMITALFHSKDAFLKQTPGLDERAMTNFYHLVELISQTLLKRQLSPDTLFKWYTDQLSKELRDQAPGNMKSDELRLESDKQAVAIVTIHKSKGLEYPVVYLPYLWDGSSGRQNTHPLFHDPENKYCLTLDLGSDDIEASQQQAEMETKAEQRRLLYVALTRASCLCNVIWGGFKSVETSALGELLHPHGAADDQAMIHDLETLKSHAPSSILIRKCDPPGQEECRLILPEKELTHFSARKILRPIAAQWSMGSFSSITHLMSAGTVNDQSAETSPEQIPEKTGNRITLADFPKGPVAGDFFHSIFEDLDFMASRASVSDLVKARANLSGFSDPGLIEAAEKSVTEVLKTMLVAPTQTFCLEQIPDSQRFNELEFLFHVNDFNPAVVKKAFELSDPVFLTSGYIDTLSQMSDSRFKGFVKGFIDLIVQYQGKWYIIDYKTNYLGEQYKDYSSSAVFNAMAEHHYFLQYHIYLVALHRYLSLRLKSYDYHTHMGGVFYLFVRGMNPAFKSDLGVFYQQPEKAAIESLSNHL